MMKNPEFKVDYFLLLENFAKFETDGQRNYRAVTARAVWPNKTHQRYLQTCGQRL